MLDKLLSRGKSIFNTALKFLYKPMPSHSDSLPYRQTEWNQINEYVEYKFVIESLHPKQEIPKLSLFLRFSKNLKFIEMTLNWYDGTEMIDYQQHVSFRDVKSNTIYLYKLNLAGQPSSLHKFWIEHLNIQVDTELGTYYSDNRKIDVSQFLCNNT
ncbi:MAG: hypothetical protein K2P99_04735 [Burkholderiales bacterium]|nr:hypothetical protein [Burkholderiales bacterium]